MGRPLFTPPPPSPPRTTINTNSTAAAAAPTSANAGVTLRTVHVDVAPQLAQNHNNARTHSTTARIRTSSGRITSSSSRQNLRLQHSNHLRRRRRSANDTVLGTDLHANTRRYLRAAALEAASADVNNIRRRTGVAVGVGVSVGAGARTNSSENQTFQQQQRSNNERTTSPNTRSGLGVRIATTTTHSPTTNNNNNNNIVNDNNNNNNTLPTPYLSVLFETNNPNNPPNLNVPAAGATNVDWGEDTDLDSPANSPTIQEMNFSFLIVENRRWREWLLRERRRAQCTISRSLNSNVRNGPQGHRRRIATYAAFCNQYFDVMLRQNDQIYLRLMRIRSRARARLARNTTVTADNNNATPRENINTNTQDGNRQSAHSDQQQQQAGDSNETLRTSLRSVAGAAAAAIMERVADELERNEDGHQQGELNVNSNEERINEGERSEASPRATTNANIDDGNMTPLDAARLVAQLRARSVMNEARHAFVQGDGEIEEEGESGDGTVVDGGRLETLISLGHG